MKRKRARQWLRRAIQRVRIAAQPANRDRALIFAEAAGILATLLSMVWELHLHLTSRWIAAIPPSLAVSCLMIQSVLAVAGLAISAASKKRAERRSRRSAHIRPLIRDRLASYTTQMKETAGVSDVREFLIRLRRRHPDDFEICLSEFLSATGGQAHVHLNALADSLGFTERWNKMASNGEMKRALIAQLHAAASATQMGELFQIVAASPMLVRVMLAGELRGVAHSLASNGLPGLLAMRQPEALIAALDLIHGWRYDLPLSGLAALMRHPDARVRACALRLAPVDSTRSGISRDLSPMILAALNDSDASVKGAALAVAARLRLRAALPSMERCTSAGDPALASLACLALATMGDRGVAILQSQLMGPDAHLGARAAEALAGAGMRRAALAS